MKSLFSRSIDRVAVKVRHCSVFSSGSKIGCSTKLRLHHCMHQRLNVKTPVSVESTQLITHQLLTDLDLQTSAADSFSGED